ncbi:MAG: hypothetical protein WCC84_13645 [Candidatus Cybelea sp.]
MMLVGCGVLRQAQNDMQPPMDTSRAMPQGRSLTARHPERVQHSRHRKSWMSPDAKTIKKLLYTSDGGDEVYVFNYKTEALVGMLAGYGQFSQGQCVDKLGNVWFTELGIFSGTGSAVEYAHGGSSPLKTLNTEGYGVGCSIDPTSGDLAVANSSNAVYGPPDIVVFKNASGTPKTYYNYYCGAPTRPGYDQNGNLYVEGHVGYALPSTVCEIPHGGKALRPVNVNVSIPIPEGVMWDGKYITLAGIIGSPSRTAIFQMVEDESGNLKKVGKTVLTDTCNGIRAEVEQPFIVGNENTPANRRQGSAVVGDNMACLSTFDYWDYPAGSNPADTFPSYTSSNQSVSIAPN